MYCIECGQRQVLQQARFCPHCGTALHVPGPAESAPEGEISPPPDALSSPPPEAVSPPPNKVAEPVLALSLRPVPGRAIPLPNPAKRLRQRLRWAIAAVVLLLAAAAAGLYYGWWLPQSQGSAIEVEQLEPAVPASAPASAR